MAAVFSQQAPLSSHLPRPGCENGSAIDTFSQFFADLEKGQSLAVYLDEVAGLGITACIAVVKYHLETAKAANFDAFLLHQGIRHVLKNGVDHNFCLLQGDVLSFGQSLGELRLVHPALLLGVVRRSPYRGWHSQFF
jgi:hypothetical protein